MKSKSKRIFVYVCGVEYQHELGSLGGSGPYEVFNSVKDLKSHTSCWRQCGIVKIELKNATWLAKQDLFDKHAMQPINKKRRQLLAFERKVTDYRHFLKQDEDYDWYYIVRTLRFKLERTRKCILENHFLTDARKVGKEIRQVTVLLKRVEENQYSVELRRPFFRKYGRPKMIIGKSTSPGSVPVTIKYPKETPANRKQIGRELRRLAAKEDQMRRADLKEAFRLMEKNIWKWWD